MGALEPAETNVEPGLERHSDGDTVEAVMATARVLVALSARAVAELGDTITLPQFRVLVMATRHSPLTLKAVASGLHVHQSNATRTVDRLVEAGLISRRNDPTDGRQQLLDLTASGHGLIQEVNRRRRAAITETLARMRPDQRQAFGDGAAAFAAICGEPPDAVAWSVGWAATG